MDERERFLWSMVVRAQEQEAQALSRDPRDMDAWFASHDVELQSRRELVQRGLNLDALMLAADDEFLARYRAVRLREHEAMGRRKRQGDLVKAAEELLARASK